MPDFPPVEPAGNGQSIDLEAYWHERKTYLRAMARLPEMRQRYARAVFVYLLRRFLWSFGFFPVFLSVWIPLILSRFNPVAMVQSILPGLQNFVNADPQQQAASIETLIIAWLSVGLTFAIFDLILTPFQSPYDYEADVHMRAWTETQKRCRNSPHPPEAA